LFSKVFGVTKAKIEEMGPSLASIVDKVSKIGVSKMRDFLLALPIFILFVRELIKRRDEIESRNRLLIIGAAAALVTLGLVVMFALLTSLPIQIMLLITHFGIGLALLTSETIVVASIIVVMLWFIIFILNTTLGDDLIYQEIRAETVSSPASELIDEIEREVKQATNDLDSLRNTLRDSLVQRGTKTDAAKVEKKLRRIEKAFKKKVESKINQVADKLENKKLNAASK
jgi:hypothetical protein